ncbi:MAG: SurA N-terminal domain-containing protein [Anaerolineae bacterium]|nr:SurA N-terminal domain-containing protein [Anaerolineae bacterium]
MRTIIVWSSISVAVLVVGLLSYGLFGERLIRQYIILPARLRDPVAIVDGEPITAGDLRERIDFLQRFYMMALPEGQTGFVLDMLVQERLLAQELARRGLAVTDEAVQRRVEEDYGYYRDPPTPTPIPTATPTPAATEVITPTPSATAIVTPAEVLTTPTPTLIPAPTSMPLPTSTPVTEEAFRESYAEALSLRGITDEEYRDYTRLQLMYEVLLEEYLEDVPIAMDQVQLRYLQVSTPGEADDLATRLEGGASFEELKAEVEADAETPGYGSELQWYTQDAVERELGADVAAQALGIQSGVFSGQQADGIVYYAVEVVDRQEDRELDEEARRQIASDQLGEWLNSRMETAVEYLDYDSDLIMVGLES